MLNVPADTDVGELLRRNPACDPDIVGRAPTDGNPQVLMVRRSTAQRLTLGIYRSAPRCCSR